MNKPINYAKGDHRVGTHCFSFTDTGRHELLGGGNGFRRVTVRMYYPADEESVRDKPRARVFSRMKEKALGRSFMMPRLNSEDRTADYYHVPIAAGKRFPLIIYNHGMGSYVEANTFLLCRLASMGYIVASVGHAHEAIETDYAGGEYDLLDKTISKRMYTNYIGALIAQTRLTKKKLSYEQALKEFDAFQRKYTPYLMERLEEWAEDTEAALAEIKRRYADSLELGRGIGITGHSFGGALAYRMCRSGGEFTCGINMDGGLFGDHDASVMKKPFATVCCAEHINLLSGALVNTEAPAYLVTCRDMKHLGFTDIRFMMNIGMFVGKIPAQEIFDELSYIHLTFFDRYLKGSGEDLKQTSAGRIKYERIV